MNFNAFASTALLSSVLFAAGQPAAAAQPAAPAAAKTADPTKLRDLSEDANEMIISDGVRKGKIVKCSNKVNKDVLDEDERVRKEMNKVEPGSGKAFKGRAEETWNWECDMDLGGDISNNTTDAKDNAKVRFWSFSLPKGADKGKGNLKDKLMDAATKDVLVSVQYNQVLRHNPYVSSTDYYATNVIVAKKEVQIIRVPAKPAPKP